MLNGEKCCFAAPAIDCVGFGLSARGIAPLQSNVDAIHKIPELTSPSQVASFLGMTAYYLWFLPHYSLIAAPLRQLLKKEEPWDWTAACSGSANAEGPAHDAPHFGPLQPRLPDHGHL